MTASDALPRCRLGEEIANSITHGIGAILAIAGLVVLVAFAAVNGGARHVVAAAIFGATMVVTYIASTLYHGIQLPRAKTILRIVDHIAIFLLIAGTYTPFTLISMRGAWGWSMFGAIWGVAVLGIVVESTPLRRWSAISLTLYLAMGWAIVVATRPLMQSVPPGGLLLLLLGGLAYTGGLGFYAWRRLPYHHTVWHLFVLAGTTLHFFAILIYVIGT